MPQCRIPIQNWQIISALGGFPATHLQAYGPDEVYTIVRDIYNSTIFSDIVKRNQVCKVDQLERVVKYTFSNVGNTFSAKSISDYLKAEHRALDNETVYSYLEKLEKAFQVTQQITSEKTEHREYERLLRIRDNYPKYVLRTDEFAGGNYEGIKTMHVADFLLSTEY